MTILPHIIGRVFNTPLLISRAKLDVILGVLAPRLRGESVNAGQPPAMRSYDLTPDGIAIIPVIGTLVRRTVGLEAESGLTSYAGIGQQLSAALADSAVKAILLDIDSPGGEAGGVFDLADQIVAARKTKPIWASANDDAFSAAYAVAAAASKIYVSRTGGVGSIGVIAMHLDQSQADADEGLKYTAIYAGAHKNDMTPHEPLSDPARATIQTEVDRVYEIFATSVAHMRGMGIEAVKATEAGLFFGEDAVTAGLADKLGTFSDALGDLSKKLSLAPPRFSLSSTRNLKRKDNRMNDPTNEPATETQGAEVAATATPAPDIEAIKAQAKAEALAYVAEVNELCQLAGMPEKAADFITKTVPAAEIRKALLTAKAASDEATTIVGQIPSNAVAGADAEPKIDTAAIYASRNNKEGK